MKRTRCSAVAVSAFGLASAALAQPCQQVVELPLLAGGVHSEAADVSADGRFVAGTSIAASRVGKAFIWSADGGVQELAYGPGIISANAKFISDDGNTVAGFCTANGRTELFRWTASGGMALIGVVGGTGSNDLAAMSPDGSTLAGWLHINGAARAYRWRAGTGVELLGTSQSSVTTISRDGQRIYGVDWVNNHWSRGYWDAAATFHVLPDPPSFYAPKLVAEDDMTWAGTQHIPGNDPHNVVSIWKGGGAGDEAFNDPDSEPFDISGDGKVVVGNGILRPNSNTRAFRWSDDGYVHLFPGVVSTAKGVDRDGGTVVGMYTKPDGTRRGYVWTQYDLGVDYTDDGMVDFFDYDAFVQCFEGGACPDGRDADFNRDGFVDFFDYDQFVLAFETGC